jgi:hypothetical protein
MQSTERPVTRRISGREYALLALTVVLTVVCLAGIAEGTARLFFPEQQRDACEVWQDGAAHMRPNCQSAVKVAEGSWVINRYNGCGYRSAAACGPKPPGTLRVVVLGTSVSRGYWIAYEDSFSGRLERTLSQQCHRPVEFQNLSIGAAIGPVWHTAASRADEAFGLGPSALVLVVTNYDLMLYMPPPRAGPKSEPAAGGINLAAKIGQLRQQFLSGSRAATMAMHAAYTDDDRYLTFYLSHGDSADFLRSPFSPAWQYRLDVFEHTVAALSKVSQAAGVPLVILFSPGRPQIVLAHTKAAGRPGVDPFVFPHALGEIVRRHGALFADATATEDLATDPDRLFYLVDGHPTPEAHGYLAQALDQALVSQVPNFAGCSSSLAHAAARGAAAASSGAK